MHLNSAHVAHAPVPSTGSPPDAVATDGTLGLRTRTLTLRQVTCRCVDEGAGRAVLFLHGAPMTSLSFARVVRALAPDYRVLVPDLPGFGASDALPEGAVSLKGYADFVHELVTVLELEDYLLFVHDSSAIFGLAAAARAPQRVAGLVVADTVPLPMTGRAGMVRWLLRHVITSRPVRALNRRFNVLAWMVATLAPFLRPFSRVERRVLVAQFDTPQKRDRSMDLFASMATEADFVNATVAAVRAQLAERPALVLFGQFDPMRFVGGFARFRQLLPRARTHVVVGEEHFPMLASGDRVARAIHAFVRADLPAPGRTP